LAVLGIPQRIFLSGMFTPVVMGHSEPLRSLQR
jgi:hypothetical protein